MPERYSGFLTPKDKESLEGYEDGSLDPTDDKQRRRRVDLRQRSMRALKDLVRLQEQVPKEDWDSIVTEFLTDVDVVPQRDVPKILGFLFAGSRATHHSVRDWEYWVRRALTEVVPAAYIDVQISVFDYEDVDELEEQYHDDPEVLTESEKEALLRTGRIDSYDMDGDGILGDSE